MCHAFTCVCNVYQLLFFGFHVVVKKSHAGLILLTYLHIYNYPRL